MATITLEVLDKKKTIPLLEAALAQQVTHVEMGILKTRQRIQEFEQKYGCPLEQLEGGSPSIDPLHRVE